MVNTLPARVLVKSFDDKTGMVTFRGSSDDFTSIPYSEWKLFFSDLSLNSIPVIYEFGVKSKLDSYKEIKPNWIIELQTKTVKLIPGFKASSYEISRIPGLIFDQIKGWYTIPLVEAWQLFEALKDVQHVQYSPEASAFIIKQLEQRTEIDSIALAKDWDFEVSLGSGIKLRNFQKVAAAFAEATNYRALLALEMGLGKTIIALALAIQKNYKTVVICPASLKNNWCREIYKLTGVRPITFSGRDPVNHDIATLLTSENKFFVLNYDIIAARTKFVSKERDKNGIMHEANVDRFLWIDLLNMAKPDMVICDESHYIKNTDSNRTQAILRLNVPRLIHMTGTPVLNRPGELWPILNSLRADLFPSEDLFLKQYTYDGKSAKNVEQLKQSLKGIMIRRKQSDVIADIPPLNRIEDYHELGAKASKLYQKVLEGVYKAVAEYDARGQEKEQSITNILVQIGRLKQVCAIDKVDSTADLAIQLHESASEHSHNKVLIFSQFKAVAYAIAQRLGHEALCFVERGRQTFDTVDSSERDRRVQQFQTDPNIKYLVVTEKTAKEGHNITEAGYVIFNDLFWTPAAHEQGEGRAYMRVNDPHGISSYYRITDMDGESIEEWVWELLHKKMIIIEQVVEGVESSRDVSIVMELIGKMKEKMGSSSYRRRN